MWQVYMAVDVMFGSALQCPPLPETVHSVPKDSAA
jgi:hypothetical protein